MRFVAGRVWNDIRSIAEKAQQRICAVGYAHNFNGISFRKGDVLVVDASDSRIMAGNTSANLVRAAWKSGAAVYSHTNLHAKVYVMDDKVIVGSANLSSTSEGLTEAIVVLTDGSMRSEALSWIELLKSQSQPVDRTFVDRICALPVHRHAWNGNKPSLLDAVRAGDRRLADDFAFTVWSERCSIKQRTIRQVAKHNGIRLKGYGFTFFQEPFSHKRESAFNALQKRFLLSFKGAGSEPNAIEGFKSLDANQNSFIGSIKIDKSLVAIFDKDKPSAYHLRGPDSKELCRLLNAGVKARPDLLAKINRAPCRLFKVDALRALVEAGADG